MSNFPVPLYFFPTLTSLVLVTKKGRTSSLLYMLIKPCGRKFFWKSHYTFYLLKCNSITSYYTCYLHFCERDYPSLATFYFIISFIKNYAYIMLFIHPKVMHFTSILWTQSKCKYFFCNLVAQNLIWYSRCSLKRTIDRYKCLHPLWCHDSP